MELDLQPIELENVSQERPLLIAGPCSAETEEQVMSTAKQLADKGIKIFRAGIWKPRTKPGGFEGIGVEGLAWLKEVKKETGMYVSTEVATAKHVYESLKAGIDILWIGARTTANPFAVQEIADALKGVDIPVYVKNPVNPDLELWIGALERINNAGLKRLGAIHRGFSSYDKNIPQPASVAYSYRTAPPYTELTYNMRPQPHRRETGTHRPTLSAGNGLGIRRINRRVSLQSGLCME